MEADNDTLSDDRVTEDFAKTAQQEAEALALFEQRFDAQFPMPETPDGIKAWKADRRIPTESQDAPDAPPQ